MSTLTTNYLFTKPAVNNSIDGDLWGDELNTSLDLIDTTIKSANDLIVTLTANASKINQNIQSASYTTVAADAGKAIVHPASDASARTFTIDSNANVPYAVGTVLTFVNEHAAGVITIAITTDTMYWAGNANSTGSRTLTAVGIATAYKETATVWIISGTGLS